MISVLLPTVRPARAAHAVGNLLSHSRDVPLEIIVVSDFTAESVGVYPGESGCVKWYVRGRKGVIDAINVAYGVSTGDVIFLTNDQTTCRPDCLRLLHDAGMARPDVLWTPRHEPYYPFYYYGKFFAAFPCAHRSLVTKLGHFLDPVYRAFYADPDLSMRAYAAGVPIDEVVGATIDHHNTMDDTSRSAREAYLLEDRETFRARWDYLGDFRDP